MKPTLFALLIISTGFIFQIARADSDDDILTKVNSQGCIAYLATPISQSTCRSIPFPYAPFGEKFLKTTRENRVITLGGMVLNAIQHPRTDASQYDRTDWRISFDAAVNAEFLASSTVPQTPESEMSRALNEPQSGSQFPQYKSGIAKIFIQYLQDHHAPESVVDEATARYWDHGQPRISFGPSHAGEDAPAVHSFGGTGSSAPAPTTGQGPAPAVGSAGESSPN
jgi:hypothetical protein